MPIAQAVHTAGAAVRSLYVPTAHGRQADALIKLPSPQTVHAAEVGAAASALYVPPMHAVHTVGEVAVGRLEYAPAAQAVQVVAPTSPE